MIIYTAELQTLNNNLMRTKYHAIRLLCLLEKKPILNKILRAEK
jgi:hypothetical protein